MDRQAARIVDANLNRVREGLRVAEEFARFVVADEALTRGLKELRHQFQEVASRLPAEKLLAARDTPGDVGTRVFLADAAQRPTPLHVARAAFGRVQEGLRALEEYAQLFAPQAAERFARLRYLSYELERQVVLAAARREKLKNARLYVLLTSHLCAGSLTDTLQAVLEGGADMIQLREKGTPDARLLALWEPLVELCRRARAPVIVNDRADLAAALGADGVHLGADDLPLPAARKVLGPTAILGATAHSLAEARAAFAQEADYLGLGTMFASPTKNRPPAGPALLAEVLAAKPPIPVYPIGGIDAANVALLVHAGADRLAVCQTVIASPDPAGACRALRRALAG